MRSLTFKLTLAFLLVSLTGIALVAVLVWGITSSEFNQYVTARGLTDYTTTVTTYYKVHGSWNGVFEALQKQGLALQSSSPNAIVTPVNPSSDNQGFNPFENSNGGRNGPPIPFILVDTNSRVITPAGPFHLDTVLPVDHFPQREAIKVNNVVVGYVVITGHTPNPSPSETRFINRTNQALVLAALGAGVIAIFLGLLLARTITRPVRDLTLAARALAAGQLKQQVPVRSKDELGELTATFNTMSADLERSNRLRKQMTADIAHDLRSPLSVITGYLEGLKDGVIKPTGQRFTAMYDEAIYLQRLVEDLRLLSLADAGELSLNCQAIQPGEVIERLAATFQHQAEQKEIQLMMDIEPDLPCVEIDPERMQQALGNLVGNALRYTPPHGAIALSARREDGWVTMEVQDNGAGMDAETLRHVFERFYRGDDSRQEGGSGLGLAIAKSIVELQGGRISAASEGLGKGSLFTIQFPLVKNVLAGHNPKQNLNNR